MTESGDPIAFRRDHLGDTGRTRSRVHGLAHEVAQRSPIVVDAYRFARDPRGQGPVWKDYLETYRRAGGFRRLPAPGSDARHALIVGLSDQVIDIKIRMAVAVALRISGWRVTVLVRSRSVGRVKRYCRAFGIRDFVAYDEVVLTADEERRCEEAVHGFLAGPMDFPSVKAWEFEGAWIGPQLLSSASRRLLEGAPDPADPAVRAEIELLLPGMLRDVCRARRVLEHVDPTIAVLDEYNYIVASPIVDMAIAADIDVITVRQMFRDDALMPMRLTKDSRRLHHASVSPETMADLAARPWTDECEQRLNAEWAARYGGAVKVSEELRITATEEHDRAAIVAELGLDPAKPIAVVFSHVLWDANLFYGEDLFDHFGDWLVQTVGAACDNPNVSWVIKLHPVNLYKAAHHGSSRTSEIELIAEHVGDLPPHVTLMYPDSKVNALSLYEQTDYGITVRGTPGIEMPCFAKPTMTAGTGRYAGLGFTVDSDTREQYLERIRTIEQLSPMTDEQVRLAKWHALALFQMREWTMPMFVPESNPSMGGHWNPLEKNLRLVEHPDRVGTDELAAWIGSGQHFDYTILELPC